MDGTDTVTRLREAITRIASLEWIIATAYNGRDFGWQVNIRDGEPKKGRQHYKPLEGSFADNPSDAALAALAAWEPALEADPVSARLGPEWRAFVEAVREDAAARRDLANTDTAVGATEVYAANDVVHAAAVLLAAEGSRDMRESHPVAPGGADVGTRDGGLASPAHVPASPAPADPAPGDEMEKLLDARLEHWRDLCHRWGPGADMARATRAAIHAEVQRREAAARGAGKVKHEGPWRGEWNNWIAPLHFCPWCGESLNWQQGEDALDRPMIHSNCCGIHHMAPMSWGSQPHD